MERYGKCKRRLGDSADESLPRERLAKEIVKEIAGSSVSKAGVSKNGILVDLRRQTAVNLLKVLTLSRQDVWEEPARSVSTLDGQNAQKKERKE